MLDASREHLAPYIVLMFLSLPMSLSLGWMCEAWPRMFAGPLAQVAWLALCGIVQSAVLFLLSALAAACTPQVDG